MFEIIKANISPQEAEELFPNNNVVMLFPNDGGNETTGDVIYVGDAEGAYAFTESIEPPKGFSFSMLRGVNLREKAAVERNFCPCCGLYEHDTPHGGDDICPICKWHDCITQRKDPDYEGGANDMSLNQARAQFAQGKDKRGNPLPKQPKTVKVRFIGQDSPLALRYGKVYDAIVGDKGWYCIVDETNEEYAYPPENFEIVGTKLETTVSDEEKQLEADVLAGLDASKARATSRPPDVEVFFEFNGARRAPCFCGYAPQHRILDDLDYLSSGIHNYYDTDTIPSDGSGRGTIAFLNPGAYPGSLWVGRRIDIQEGSRVVGYATIEKIFNPVMVNDEQTALRIKLLDPDAQVTCPRCGNEIIREQRGNSIAVMCLTDGCLVGGRRGI